MVEYHNVISNNTIQYNTIHYNTKKTDVTLDETR